MGDPDYGQLGGGGGGEPRLCSTSSSMYLIWSAGGKNPDYALHLQACV